MAGNGSSYQNDGKGNYQPIGVENGNGSTIDSNNGGGSKKKLVSGMLIFAALAAVGYYMSTHKAGDATNAAVAKAGLPKSKKGTLKLFDDERKLFTIENTHTQKSKIFIIYFHGN
jgi:hypothetical protein